MWQKLASNLAYIIKQYQQLDKLGAEKRRVLALVDMKGLEKVTKQEEGVISAINRAEIERQELVKNMAAAGIKISESDNLSMMCRQCPDQKQRQQLQGLHQMLNKLVSKVKQTSENNEFIITAALNAVKFKLNQLGGTAVEDTYGSRGQEKVSHESNLDFNV